MSEEQQNIETIEVVVSRVETDAEMDDVLAMLDRVAALGEFFRRIKEEGERRAIDWIEKNGPMQAGTVKWWVGNNKTTKCRDIRAAIEAIFEKSGGDWDAFVTCLSSNAIKHGAARGVLGDEWGNHFEVIEKPKLENDAPKKELQKLDTRFLKG